MKIGVLMGGRSPEREISLKTGKNILAGLIRAGYDAVGIDAKENVVEEMKRENVDMAFIALHGPLGEDGTIQGLLEFLNIPYTGAGVLGSSLAMNKVATKQALIANGIKTPDYFSFNSNLLEEADGMEQIEKIEQESGIGLPVVVKPSAGGSTIGTHIIKRREDLESAYRDAAKYCNEILVEKFVPGIEITVGVLGSQKLTALPVIEIIAEGGFYNYYTKYQPGKSTHIIPARLPENIYKEAMERALKVFKATHCYGMGRVDFIVADDELWCLEINTIPGMTETSLLPEAAEKAGISFEALLKMQVDLALNRHVKMQEVCYV
ncbi:MAG: D-alanine--D-alanine ligase [Firmicutes bacterium]|nr:D-alanine--D-alanine ligase [Bacillota bacterium]